VGGLTRERHRVLEAAAPGSSRGWTRRWRNYTGVLRGLPWRELDVLSCMDIVRLLPRTWCRTVVRLCGHQPLCLYDGLGATD